MSVVGKVHGAGRRVQHAYQRWSSVVLVVLLVVGIAGYYHQQSQTNSYASTAASYGKANNQLAHELKSAQHALYVSGNRHHNATQQQNSKILDEEKAIAFLGTVLAQDDQQITTLLNEHSTEFAQQQAADAAQAAQAQADTAFLNDLKQLATYLVQGQQALCAANPAADCPPVPSFTPVP